MRGKRSKQYKKLMQQYALAYGFREPYQVLVDAEVIKDADKFKMDLIAGLERTLHGQVKPMITQCCMRHLYAAASEPGVSYLIDKAKTYERRRCGHRPEDYPEPLSAKECLASVIDPKDNKNNKNSYVVASQELEVRKNMRGIMGVPLVYINRSVMIMEPMAGASAENRDREERGKFRAGLKRGSGSLKRKRENEADDGDDDGEPRDAVEGAEEAPKKKKRTMKGQKQPNPLAVKKPKKKKPEGENGGRSENAKGASDKAESSESIAKRKRKRKHKSTTGDESKTVVGTANEEE